MSEAAAEVLWRLHLPHTHVTDAACSTVDAPRIDLVAPGARGESTTTMLRRFAHRQARAARIRVTDWPRSQRRVVQPLPPSGIAPGIRGGLARVVRSGLVVLPPNSSTGPRVIDDVAAAAGVRLPRRVMLSAAGGVLALTTATDGRPVVLRVARARGPGDPHFGARVMASLASVAGVPELVGLGVTAGMAWVVEQRMPGRTATRLTSKLTASVVELLTALPRAPGPATAPIEDLRLLAALGVDETAVERLRAELPTALASLPAVVGHRDVWTGNLLVRAGRVSGLVDWDGAHPATVAGCDLLHLMITDRRRKLGLDLAGVWALRPWTWSALTTGPASALWPALEVEPGPDTLKVLTVAWWLGHVAGTLRRLPHRGCDAEWIRRNVTGVLEDLPV